MSPALCRFQRLSSLSKAASFDSRVCLRRRDASESSDGRLEYVLHLLNCVTSAIRAKAQTRNACHRLTSRPSWRSRSHSRAADQSHVRLTHPERRWAGGTVALGETHEHRQRHQSRPLRSKPAGWRQGAGQAARPCAGRSGTRQRDR